MIRTWKNLAVVAAVVLFTLPSIASAQGSDSKKEKLPEPDLKTLQLTVEKGFKDIGEDMNKLQNNIIAAFVRIEALEKQVKLLQKPEPIPAPNGLEGRIIRIEDTIAKIEQHLAKTQAPNKVTALRPPGAGRMLLDNHYNGDLIIYINEQRREVRAKSSIIIDDVPAGPFTYKIIWNNMIVSEKSGNLNPGQTFTISAE